MLAVLTTMCSSLRQTRSTHATLPRRIASTVLATLSQPMSLAKWLKVPPGKTARGRPFSTAMPAAHETVPSPPPTASTSACFAASRSAATMSSSPPSSTISAVGKRLTHFVDDPRSGSAARCGVDHQHHARAVGSWGRVDPERIGGRDLRRDDRRHDARTEHGDARTDAEAGEHVARIVRADGDTGQPDQPGKQGESQSDGRVLQPDPDRECRGAGGMAGRQRVRCREAVALPRQRHRHAIRPRPFPDPLGDLVGEQAGHRQADDTAQGAACGCRMTCRHQCRSDHEPQLGMVGGPAQPGHRGVQQRARRLRNRLEDLAIEGAETLANLAQALQALWFSPKSHDANVAGPDDVQT